MTANGQHLGLPGKDTDERIGDQDECRRAHRHNGQRETDRASYRIPAAAVGGAGIIVADHRHDAGLQAEQRNEEKCLQLVIEAQHRDRGVGKACKDHIQTYNIDGIERLDQLRQHHRRRDRRRRRGGRIRLIFPLLKKSFSCARFSRFMGQAPPVRSLMRCHIPSRGRPSRGCDPARRSAQPVPRRRSAKRGGAPNSPLRHR